MAELTGLVQKFEVKKLSKPYPRHDGEYFTLAPKRDKHAAVALLAYAASIESENPVLAEEIRTWIKV